MNPQIFKRGQEGYTLIEISISTAVMMVVFVVAYSLMMSSTNLLAKNISLNQSNVVLRNALDRVYVAVNQANGLPKLINADGSNAPTSGPAAGIIYDRYLGGPYIVTNPGATGLSASTQSFQIKRSTDGLASPPIPKLNDVIHIDNGLTRPVVNTCTASTAAADLTQALAVTLKNPLGSNISWTTSKQQSANLVHREAFVVVPVNNNERGELRFYKDAETVTNFNDAAGYVVLNREIGTKVQGGEDEAKPFTIIQKDGVGFLNIAMRVEDRTYNKALASRQTKEFNTFLRVNTMQRPRNFF